MAGSDEAVDEAVDEAAVADDDALYVLTAVLLTPAKFPSVLGDDYPEACAALGLVPIVDGYGLVLGQDGQGARWTVVVDDVSLVAVAIASWDCGMEYDLSPDDRTVVSALAGWPLAVAVAAPGVPAPHDPEPDPEDPDQPVLTPPDTTSWGPAQRRLGADEIALQWASWRAQVDESLFVTGEDGRDGAESSAADETVTEPEPEAAEAAELADEASGGRETTDAPGSDARSSGTGNPGGEGSDTGRTDTAQEGSVTEAVTEAAPEAESGTGGADPDGPSGAAAADTTPAEGSPSAVRRVLAEARAYIDTPPPLGRVRSSFASGEARTLRADGPGWSLVARTDDIAFVLLDEEPGEVVPVGRGPELPGLLEALDRMAVRPS
ncbi:hypothetical protein [Streptomyces sp. KLOTTS4A1]|uniref:hypothetical protein n=1 Tax=Streptomyces sp. KLOTTS4A1 TaxID=3390996 RepID=UPI0039F639EE